MKDYVYLAGKITGLSKEEIHGWREIVKECLGYRNINWLDPSVVFDIYGYQSEQEIMRYELRAVKNSTVVLVNLKNVETSVGTIMELATAFENNIPIIGFYDGYFHYDKVHPWIIEVVDRVFDKKSSGSDIFIETAVYIQSIYY